MSGGQGCTLAACLSKTLSQCCMHANPLPPFPTLPPMPHIRTRAASRCNIDT